MPIRPRTIEELAARFCKLYSLVHSGPTDGRSKYLTRENISITMLFGDTIAFSLLGISY